MRPENIGTALTALVVGIAAFAGGCGGGEDPSPVAQGADSLESTQVTLLVADVKKSSIRELDAASGVGGTLVTPGSGGLSGPRGLVAVGDGSLLVSNQNVELPINGEILRYDARNGSFMGALVPASSPSAPFAPRGIVLGSQKDQLFVADMFSKDGADGRIARYDAVTGAFLGNLDASRYREPFRPRGVVFGPDGMLYVSVTQLPDPLGGAILQFDTARGTLHRVFARSDAANGMHRPEGLVFGPDGELYVTSFRAGTEDTDKILVFAGPYSTSGPAGTFLRKIDLASPVASGGKRAYAQALLFGPGGRLFVPISGDAPDTTGELRRYDVRDGTYEIFVKSGPLGAPWYLSFGQTNPATLAYEGN